MSTKTNVLLAVLTAAILLIPVASPAGSNSNHDGHMMNHEDTVMKGSTEGHGMNCPALVPGAEVKVKNTNDGVVMTITGKDKETIKSIQEKAVQCEDHVKAMGDEVVTCPVMGTKIKKSQAVGTSTYNGKTYYFCCGGCKPAFDKNPQKYVNK